jgi:hypothetical protein
MTTGIKLDLCFCTIPTVGFYGKHGEVTSPPPLFPESHHDPYEATAYAPLARLMSRGDRVQLLRSLDLEYEWERARQEERSDGEWGRRHGRRALLCWVLRCVVN